MKRKGTLRLYPLNWISSKKNKALIESEICSLQQDPLLLPGWIYFILVADYQVSRRYVLSPDSFKSTMKSSVVQYEVGRQLADAANAVIVVLIEGLKDYDYCVVEKAIRLEKTLDESGKVW
jgi:hypothetical protein